MLDDLLLNFDDERATACLHVLMELSHRTQILFFTHHAHLVELAQTHLPSDNLFVTTLADAIPTGETQAQLADESSASQKTMPL